MKATKTQKLLARQFREAARDVAERDHTYACIALSTVNPSSPETIRAFMAILRPRIHNHRRFWLGDNELSNGRAIRYVPSNSCGWPSGHGRAADTEEAREQRVIGLLLCAEYVLTTKL